MKRSRAASLTLLIVLTLAGAAVGVFKGYFDSGRFEVTQVRWASPKLVAMVARRSDDDALNSDQYFVLVGDHPFSARELRYAYYHHGLIFRSGGACVTTSWKDGRSLVISCYGIPIEAEEIAVEQRKKAGVDVSYVNIPVIPERE